MFRREAHVYVGIDIHKRSNVAVMVNCFGEPMGKAMKFDNTPAAYPEWLEKVRQRAGGKGIIFGLEDCHGLGRHLALFLVQRGEVVKFVNAYATKKTRDSIHKSDALDALAVAKVTAEKNVGLPDADMNPLQWALLSTVAFRRGLVQESNRLKNRLHALLLHNWPNYDQFFSQPFDSKTALAFWHKYPSQYRLAGVRLEELAAFLREESHCAMGEPKAAVILAAVSGEREPAYQFQQDELVCSAIDGLRSLQKRLADVEAQLGRLLAETDYRLTHIPGIDVVTAAELVALVGDVTRFRNVNKFLAYTGIAPTTQGTGETENRYRSRYGRRELNALFYRIATSQLVVHARTGQPRNPEARAYYERLLGPEAALPARQRNRKVVKKAILSLMRQQAKRFYRLMKQQKCEAMARRAGGITQPNGTAPAA